MTIADAARSHTDRRRSGAEADGGRLRAIGEWLLPAGTVLAALAVWETASRAGWVSRSAVPPVSEVAAWLAGELTGSSLYAAFGSTLLHWAGGLAIGTGVGLVFGLAMALSRAVERLATVPFEFLRPVPSVIYLPVALLLLGATDQLVVLLVVLAVVWPVLFQTFYGARATDPLLLETGRAYGLTLRQRLTSIVLPQSLPFVGTGIRIASSIALVSSVALEMVVGSVSGTGSTLRTLQLNGVTEGVYAYAVLLGVLGYLLNELVHRLERRVLWWHRPYRRS